MSEFAEVFVLIFFINVIIIIFGTMSQLGEWLKDLPISRPRSEDFKDPVAMAVGTYILLALVVLYWNSQFLGISDRRKKWITRALNEKYK